MIDLERIAGWFTDGGRSARANAFAQAAFPGCARHRTEALATFEVLERLLARRLDHLDIDAPLSEVLPSQEELSASSPMDVIELVMVFEEECGPCAAAAEAEANEDMWAAVACQALLGPGTGATWFPGTIWSRSLRGFINARVGDAECSCGDAGEAR